MQRAELGRVLIETRGALQRILDLGARREDIDGGTITVSNIGSLDRALSGCMPLLEIIPPQVCAISLGPVQERPVVVRPEGTGEPRVAVGKVLPVGVVFDHRALDFGDVAPFVLRLQKLLRDPAPLFSGM